MAALLLLSGAGCDISNVGSPVHANSSVPAGQEGPQAIDQTPHTNDPVPTGQEEPQPVDQTPNTHDTAPPSEHEKPPKDTPNEPPHSQENDPPEDDQSVERPPRPRPPSNENWPGFAKDGEGKNASLVSLDHDLDLEWMYLIEGQIRLRGQKIHPGGYAGSLRSKNLAIRDGRIAVLIPNGEVQSFGFVGTQDGQLKRRFDAAHLSQSGFGEFNRSGIEGRDLRSGQFLVYWHQNGNIYARSSGDGSISGAYSVAKGKRVLGKIGPDGTSPGRSYNQSGYFRMHDKSNWYFVSWGGHSGLTKNWKGGSLSMGHIDQDIGHIPLGLSYRPAMPSLWAAPFLIDGEMLYTLEAIHHPKYPPDVKNKEAPIPPFVWLGAQVRGYRIKGQTATREDQGVVFEDCEEGETNRDCPEFVWKENRAFVANDSELANAPKAFCVGTNELYLAYLNIASPLDSLTPEDEVRVPDFREPLVLAGIDRKTGDSWTTKLGITGRGASTGKQMRYNNTHSFFPQIACADLGGPQNEWVAVMLPEAYRNTSTRTAQTGFKTRIAVVNTQKKKVAWTFEYPHSGDTTPLWIYGGNTNTKMLIAGEDLYVVYLKTEAPLNQYIDRIRIHRLFLHVDRFSLADGTKTESRFPLDVGANTVQLDDLAAVNGALYVLATYFEYFKDDAGHAPRPGGAQFLAKIQ